MTGRPRQARGASRVGERFEGTVGPVAHGGHCVLRLEDGPVVFTRHALPGERVVVQIAEGTDGDRFWRGDAVEVLQASPDRVEAPCPVSGPDGCGGCDFQHVALPAQRALKAEVVAEQLRRLAGLEAAVTVEPVPGDRDGLRWRTRQRYARLPDGRRAMRKHRSHDLVPVEDCLIAAPGGPSTTVRGRSFSVAEGGFWQVHPGAPEALVGAVLEALDPRPGESVLDLYAGVGLFAAFVAEAAGARRVVAVEGDRDRPLPAPADNAEAPVRQGRVDPALGDAAVHPVDQFAETAREQGRDKAAPLGKAAIRRDQMFAPLQHSRR